ncbi:hypothetical protein ACEN2T_17760 [Pseudomonas sp. W22_MBD1_FP4]|uniref:hypothetical protein n=1 Tax=Pseudomonas sp. W22_MBD1_FP4 TaxID=3240272 RepID=UPI003F9A8970
MTGRQDMKLADIFWKLDSIAESSVISVEASTAARDAVRALREITRALAVDPSAGADSVVASVEGLQERFRKARKQASYGAVLLNNWMQTANISDEQRAALCSVTAAHLAECDPVAV